MTKIFNWAWVWNDENGYHLEKTGMAIEISTDWILVVFNVKFAAVQASGYIYGSDTQTLNFGQSSGSQNSGLASAASAIPGKLRERWTLRFHPLGCGVYPLNQKFCVWGPAISVWKSPSGDSKCMPKFENYCFRWEVFGYSFQYRTALINGAFSWIRKRRNKRKRNEWMNESIRERKLDPHRMMWCYRQLP